MEQAAGGSLPSHDSDPQSARDRWASSGLVAFRLPSGFIVSGVWPSMTDLIRRGLMSWRLRDAVVKTLGTEQNDLSDEDVQRNLEQRLRVAANFIRGLYDDETGEWEPLRLTFEELTDGTFPGEDVEALDTFAYTASRTSPELAAEMVSRVSEVGLGLIADAQPKEPADTLVDWAEFRGQPGGTDAGAERGDLVDAAEPAAGDSKPARRVSSRRRTSDPPPA